MSPGHEEVLDRAYRLFNARAVDEALALMADDVEWPNVAEGSLVQGRDAVRRYWEAQLAVGSPVVVPLRYIHADEDVVVEVRQRVDDLSGTPIVQDHVVYHRYSFTGALVRRMTVHAEERAALSA